MKSKKELILKISLYLSIMLTAFSQDILFKGLVLLSLAALTIVFMILEYRNKDSLSTREKIAGGVSFLAIVIASYSLLDGL